MLEAEIRNARDTSEEFSRILRETDVKLFEWADLEGKMFKRFLKKIEFYRDALFDMEEEWFISAAHQYVAGGVFTKPSRLKKFFSVYKSKLDKEEDLVINFFIDHPWFYSLFSIEQTISKNYFRIYDYCKDRSLLLYSEDVQQLHRYGSNLFLCLLFNNGECHQSYNFINYFRGFNVRDIEFFTTFVDGRYPRERELVQSIALQPIPFMLLSQYADNQSVFNAGERTEYCWHSIKVEGFDPTIYHDKFNIKEKKGTIKCTLKKSDDPGFFSVIYYEKKSGILHLYTLGITRYEELVKAFNNIYPFPDEPSWRVGTPMLEALYTILGIDPPHSRFERIFNDKAAITKKKKVSHIPPSGTKPELEDLIDQDGFPRQSSARYEAKKKFELPYESIRTILEKYSREAEEDTIKIEGGFNHFIPPSPSDKLQFCEPFTNNGIFEFHNSTKAEMLSKIKLPSLLEDMDDLDYDRFSLQDLPEFIEDFFFDFWDVQDSSILLYTFFLLSRKGKNFLPVKDYAVEYLRLFWQTVLIEDTPAEIRDFIESYALFCYFVLQPVGLVEFDREIDEYEAEKADFAMRASSFFFEWIRLIHYH